MTQNIPCHWAAQGLVTIALMVSSSLCFPWNNSVLTVFFPLSCSRQHLMPRVIIPPSSTSKIPGQSWFYFSPKTNVAFFSWWVLCFDKYILILRVQCKLQDCKKGSFMKRSFLSKVDALAYVESWRKGKKGKGKKGEKEKRAKGNETHTSTPQTVKQDACFTK